MKPRDKTVLPFALPAISVVVVILIAMSGKTKPVKKLSTTNDSQPFYSAAKSLPNALNDGRTLSSDHAVTVPPNANVRPVWPGAIHRLPAVETELGFPELEFTSLESAESSIDILEPANSLEPSMDQGEEFAIVPPVIASEELAPLEKQIELPTIDQKSITSPEVNNDWSVESPNRLADDQNFASTDSAMGSVEDVPFEPEPMEVELDPLLDGSIPDPDSLLTLEPEPARSESIVLDAPEPTLAAPSPTPAGSGPYDLVAPIDDGLADSADSTAKVERKRPWAPVDLRSVDVDLSVGEADNGKIEVASGENKRQAMKAVELGFELIQRGAPYSARARFIESMRSVSRSLDEQNGTHAHTAALRKALSAYNEAGDFFPKSTRPDEDVNISSVVSGHNTEILHDANVAAMTSGQCVQEYLAFAEQEFTKAFGREEIASRALYGLGRLEWDTATTTTSTIQVRTYRAISLYQSALVVHDGNFAAANELGVLFARHGNYQNAIAALRHCVALSPQPTAWQNLANLYHRLGKIEEARWAEIEATHSANAATGVPYAVAKPRIEWVNPEDFNRLAQNGNSNVMQLRGNPNEPVARTASRPAPQPSERTNRRFSRRPSFPFGFRNAK